MEYWMFTLIQSIIVFAISIVVQVSASDNTTNPLRIVLFAYIVISIVPSLSCAVRRLHDTGRSGWWYFISLIPLIGGIALLVFFCMDSEPDRNQYGPNPKQPGFSRIVI